MIVRETLDNHIRLVTETMPHVRSVSVGVWLTRGSRHEAESVGGIAHFVEHMLFKGTKTRSAEDIAQAIDSIGGQLDAFTSKEYAGYYIKVLDEHLPVALDVLSDVILRPAFAEDDIDRERKVILEEIKMVEDTPDDLVHEMFTQTFWEGHPLGRPILGTPETVQALTRPVLQDYFSRTYVAPNLIVSAAGNLQHEAFREALLSTFRDVGRSASEALETVPAITPRLQTREKELEQSHICLGTRAYPQNHADRYVLYLLNTLLGGSMSSRLFQNIREKRGLAYSVFSGLAAYRDTGMLSVYAGCANESVAEVIDLILAELRTVRDVPIASAELQRAKDHLKGNLMLSLESTSSRMTHLARQDIYFDQHFTLDETLAGIDRVTADDVRRVAADLFSDGALGATVLGAPGLPFLPPSRLRLD
ncbi:MAG: M16 family metallopeptidase [Vicinamibacterales bacterium]